MARSAAQKVLDRLREELRSGPEPISSIEEKVGRARGYFRGRWYAGSIPLDVLLETLAVKKENPVAFFARAFDQPMPEDLDLMPACRTEPPPIVGRALSRLVEDTPATIGPRHLEKLDDMRYEDPMRARRMAEDVIDCLAPADLPLALGIWASAGRLRSRLEEGRHALRLGFDIAQRLGDGRSSANMVQRAAYLEAAGGDSVLALRLAERAAVLFTRLGDLGAVARTLVDQANLMLALDRHTEAETAFRSAFSLFGNTFGHPPTGHEHSSDVLEGLSNSECRNLQAAYLGLAHCHFQDGRIDASAVEVEKAAALVRSTADTGFVRWLEGKIWARRGSWNRAQKAYEEATECLLEISPINAALVGCDQIRMQIEAGWHQLARRTAFAMVRLVEPLEHNRVAQSAIRDLVCCHADGHRLTLDFLDRIRPRLEDIRHRLAFL